MVYYVHLLIEAFRSHYVDGAELYKISQKQQSLKAGAIARTLKNTDPPGQEKLFDIP